MTRVRQSQTAATEGGLSRAPVAEHAVARGGRGVVACGDDQFTTAQFLKSDLDGAFGKACCVGEHSYTRGDRFPFLPRSLAVKIEVNQICSRLLIVPD